MSNKPSGKRKEQRAAAAAKVAEMRRQQAAKERRRNIMIGVLVAAVVALIVGGAVYLNSTRDTTGDTSAAVPSGLVDTQGFVRGQDSAPVHLIMYEDFMCPICGEFEKDQADFLAQQVAAENVQVEYRPIAILDGASNGTNYSTRSADAAACVLTDAGATAAGKMHDLLYANQPEENSDGLTDSQLADLAVQAGADRSKVQTCIDDQTYKGWVANVTDQSSKDGVTGTPTAVLNGNMLDTNTTLVPAAFQQAVTEAVNTGVQSGGSPSAP
jgi:protein-disulfide isomerase